MTRVRWHRKITAIVVVILLISLAAPLVNKPALAQGSNYVIVNTGAANIRSGPAGNTVSLGSVQGGTSLPVTGRTEGSTWWRVDSPVGVGWISDELVIFRGVIDAVPIVSEPTGTLETPTIIVDRYPATVYGNPNAKSFIVGIVPTGAVLTVVGRSSDGNWWQVSTSLGMGWINIAEVALRGDENLVPRVGDPGPSFQGPTIRVNADTPVTVHPGGGDMVTTLPAGTQIPAGGRTADNTWWQVAGDFGFGWILVSNVSLAGSSENIPVSAQQTFNASTGYSGAVLMNLVIESERKVIYHKDSFDSDPMWDARLGESLGVMARSGNGLWLEVLKANGWRGWIHFSGVTLQGSLADLPIVSTYVPVQNVAIANTGRLNIRSGPGAEYVSLTSVPGGTTLNVTGRHPTLPWLRVEGPYGVGWVRILYIIFRGMWNTVPVVTEPVGELEMPQAVVTFPHNVYVGPSNEQVAGVIEGGLYIIVGWSVGYKWAKIDTPLGQVWISRDEIEIRGTAENAPIIA